jgi:hypothetical protein
VDIRDMLRIAGRHLVIIWVGLMATGIVAGYLVSQVEPEYEAKASVLLLTPTQVETPEGTLDLNPLENPQGVATTASALTDVMRSAPFDDRLRDEGLVGDFEVTVTPESGAILNARTAGADGPETFADLQLVIEQLRVELAEIQRRAGIAESTWIRAEILTAPNEATELSGSKLRVGGVTLLVGAAATYGLAFLADLVYGDRKFIRGRRERRRARKASRKAEHTTDRGLGDQDDERDGNGHGDLPDLPRPREPAERGSLFRRTV